MMSRQTTTCLSSCFFFNDTATTEIYTLSLHDALPISHGPPTARGSCRPPTPRPALDVADIVRTHGADRKSTRLNSSHVRISYAVFCLKKKRCAERTDEKKDGQRAC